MSGVRFETDGGVAIITIERPERRNAIDRPTAEALAEAFDELDARGDLAAGVLTGAGPIFCAGMDLKALAETGERPDTVSRGMFGIVQRPPRAPLVAGVEGAALGGGLEIALACDLIVAARGARLGTPEVTRGLVPSAGGMLRLPRRIPQATALELLLTGAPVTAERGYELGLVNRLCEPGAARAGALELAAAIAANAPLAVGTAKQLVAETAQLSIADGFAHQREAVQRVRDSEDAAEGGRAFVEKRAPQWVGR